MSKVIFKIKNKFKKITKFIKRIIDMLFYKRHRVASIDGKPWDMNILHEWGDDLRNVVNQASQDDMIFWR